jgi:cyclopropane-fatty-acyl-phospholipid synthase
MDRVIDTAGRAATPLQRLLRKRLLPGMEELRDSQLTVVDALGEVRLGRLAAHAADTLRATVHVADLAFYRDIALNGSVGAGEAYIEGRWECDDLVALVRMLVRNRERLDRMDGGLAQVGGVLMRAWHALRRNTRRGSRGNVAAHYDLGNELFATFLDDNLMYSSALFGTEGDTLEAASARKLDRICRKLQLAPGDRVVEVGGGWGGFALHAARHFGCHVTTTTISRAQFEHAGERVRAAGLGARIQVLQEDYRDLHGRYDKLVSIEMIEAIGHQYLDTFFAKAGALLHAHGMALIQAITIEDHRYAQALRAVDFIKRHVFPGSFIPSISAMLGAAARTSDLKLFNLEDIGPSYARTLACWRSRFQCSHAAVRALGYDERFVRLWNFYLAYCEGGFRERSIGTAQMLMVKPGCDRAQFVPPGLQA